MEPVYATTEKLKARSLGARQIARLVQSTTTAARAVLTLEQQAKLAQAPAAGGRPGMTPGMGMPEG